MVIYYNFTIHSNDCIDNHMIVWFIIPVNRLVDYSGGILFDEMI